MSRIQLAKFRKNASHKKCSRCNKIKPSSAFARQRYLCLECRNERQADIEANKRDRLKEAAGDCWWLERYFIISAIEISRIKKSYR